MGNHKPMATCEQGELVVTEEKEVLAFYNLPYGADKGRFMPVGEVVKWSGSRDATKPGSVFPQSPSRLAVVMGTKKEERNQREDVVVTVNYRLGACYNELTIRQYMHTVICPYCQVIFNERCASHFPIYFEQTATEE